MGSSRFERIACRAQADHSGILRPSINGSLPQGTAEMAMVVTGRFHNSSPISQSVIDHFSAGSVDGFFWVFGGGALAYNLGTGVGVVSAFSRGVTAADVGKLSRFVGTSSVIAGQARCYWNMVSGSPAAIAAYSPGVPENQTLLDNRVGSGGLSLFDLVSFALLENATFTAAQVKELDEAILANGGAVPDDFANWSMLVDAGELNGNAAKGPLSAGGQYSAIAYQSISSPVTTTVPVLSTVDTSPGNWGPTLP